MNISEDDARKGMKDIGLDEFVINYVIELSRSMKMGYLSPVTSVVEEVTGKRATLSVNLQKIMQNLLDDIQIRWVIVPGDYKPLFNIC